MSAQKEFWIVNANIVTEQGIVTNGSIQVIGSTIAAIHENGAAAPQGEVIDAQGSWVLPGFIDVHVHGGYGADFMDASKESLDTITRFHSSMGTTSIVATSMTAPREALDDVVESIAAYRSNPMPYAQVVGLHLEGPFLNPSKIGAQNPDYVVLPQIDWIQTWYDKYPGLIKTIALAPEREGALAMIEWCRDHGIVTAAAHTEATYADMQAAAKHGLSHSVHMYNAMKPLHHREPGTVGSILTMDEVSAEIIADGVHVHPTCIKLLAAMKTQENLLLITDAMSAAGLDDGLYQLGGQDVLVKGGVARLKDGETLAGSTLTMIRGFQFLVEEVGLSVEQVSKLASGNPAKLLGLSDTIGSIAAGKHADLLLVTPSFELERVYVQGRQIQ
ncbi:N-acetylglucosamine-6-phosphate deacetylase [Paenibacillus albiflavus]|uniref:N-acetylglucosamine-6-phosphate deacetylase n=1 Tax=Paenibacillus albiflavus TaxID=2545760 RepID=A0A4R4E860_9BACL|nr:N-acetylglucosamine-6-phosphate deacetylase [Paenibacillus albiflavus]TCZ75327.1 N-acetylglucosamine-6-phosphate deacetylase [Paenibacillus albiflavus]